MRYYDLRDDVAFPGRWILSDPVTDSGCTPFDFRRGAKPPIADPNKSRHADDFIGGTKLLVGEPNVDVQRPGIPLAFSMTLLEVPIVTIMLGDRVAAVAGRDLQRIPVRLANRTGYEILNSLRVIDALDETRSEFMKWTAADGRPDKVGEYRMVTRLRVDPRRLPSDAHFFRLQGWLIALIVSHAVKESMEEAGCLGALFREVT
jgi:hypothetical protein